MEMETKIILWACLLFSPFLPTGKYLAHPSCLYNTLEMWCC